MIRQKLLQLGWEVLIYPPYSKDIAPSHFHLFWSLQNSLGRNQDGGVEDMLSLPLVRTPESQLAAGQSLTGRHWNSPKKTPHIQRQRRSHNEMVGGAQSQ